MGLRLYTCPPFSLNCNSPRRIAAEGTARSIVCRLRKAEALVVRKEVGLAAQNFLGDDWAADGAAEAAVVETRIRDAVEVVLPGVGIEIVVG